MVTRPYRIAGWRTSVHELEHHLAGFDGGEEGAHAARVGAC